MKKLHNMMIAALSLLATASVALGVHTLTVANAATLPNTESFKMENGAAARIKTLTDAEGNVVESNGLRFSAEISETEYTALKEAGAKFGAVIVAKDLAKTVEINEETVFGANPSFYFSNETQTANGKISMLHIANAACENIDEDANIEIAGSITNIAVSNFTRSFIGRVYVAMPQTDENGEVTGYTYQFAPYYEGNVANNTRCIYYVAQRAVEEEKGNADVLQEKYIDVFAQTDRFTKYTYRYVVQHHYLKATTEGSSEMTTLHTETQSLYAQLNSEVSAYPIAKPLVDALNGMDFIFDVAISEKTQTGLVYAAGMQTLHMYYVKAADISEEDKDMTLDTVLEEFLSDDSQKVANNFGIDMSSGSWTAETLRVDPNDENSKPTGITLETTSPNSDGSVTLSKEFFANLHAFGVSTVTFSAYAIKNGKQEISVQNMYIGDTGTKMPFTDVSTETEKHRLQINISDLMVDGVVTHGIKFVFPSNVSSNEGAYKFENVIFGFPTKGA